MNSASKSAAKFVVFALNPCAVLDDTIRRAKTRARALAGEQTYLSHPPHLTLYVAAFDALEPVATRCAELVATWSPPQVEIIGWHHFKGDVLTGNHTLVCEIAEKCKVPLREHQTALIQTISDMRCKGESASRYRPHFSTLSQARQEAVELFGFPFVGNDWIPHLSVGSIDPKNWNAVWEALEDDPPQGKFYFPKLTIYRLQNDFPEPWRELAITG